MRWLAPAAVTAAALVVAACGSSGNSGSSGSSGSSGNSGSSAQPSGSAASGNALKTTTIHGLKVLTNAKGRTLYSFVPDTSTKSNCNGACAQVWPPVRGPATAGTGVSSKPGTIKRSTGTLQATYKGHPLYTYTADSAPGQDNGNGINSEGGVWHVVPAAGGAAPAASGSGSSSGLGGY
jgi:predicted lipoprotein with Yx(FWY)xxD motif